MFKFSTLFAVATLVVNPVFAQDAQYDPFNPKASAPVVRILLSPEDATKLMADWSKAHKDEIDAFFRTHPKEHFYDRWFYTPLGKITAEFPGPPIPDRVHRGCLELGWTPGPHHLITGCG